MAGKVRVSSGPDRIQLAGLYLCNTGAQLFGFVVIILLNTMTPLEFIRMQRIQVFTQGGWSASFLFVPFVFLLSFLIQRRLQAPIVLALRRIEAGEDPSGAWADPAKRGLLNLPVHVLLWTMGLFILTPAFVVTFFYLFRHAPAKVCFFLYFRAFMIGPIASSISFFLIEAFSRKRLIPLFFPKGGVSNLAGVFKISILRRIRLLNAAGTVNPMIILVVTLFFIWGETEAGRLVAPHLFREIVIFTLVLSALFIGIALRLNFMVGDSIVAPLSDMLRVVRSVKQGDFTSKILVQSNDELGVLADAGNEMIRGLEEREFIHETFGKYVSPEIRDKILAGKIPLNGERRVATLLFSDLRNFTSYVEENSPEEVIRSLREYFSAMEAAVRRHRGLVLQYVGDEIEAVFGIPLEDEGHADRALQSAIDMRQALKDLNEKRAGAGIPPFRHGIGIYTGAVLAGNTGSKERLSYALVGNTVNLASRIQELTKDIGSDILVSEETVRRLQRPFALKAETPVTVKGFSRPLAIYRVMES